VNLADLKIMQKPFDAVYIEAAVLQCTNLNDFQQEFSN